MPFVGDELYKYIKERMPSFLLVNVTELLPHLSCLTQMDQERVRAQVRMEGNESAVPMLLDSVRRRRNWERQLINALRRNEYHDLADGLENKLGSLAPRRQSPPGDNSTECKLPVQEMGNPLDKEESKDHRLPIQEKTALSDLSKSSDFPQGQQNQTKHSNQGNTGEKCNVRSTNQAKGGIISDEAIVIAPPPTIQVHPPRPSRETSLPVIDKPGVLMSNVGNNELATESTCDLPEGGCSISSRDLQFSENTTSNTGNNGSGSSAPLNHRPVPKHVSDDFSDENSIKEQKIQALRGYQNDRLQEPFYDVNNPLNIQMNFDALKKITALDEGAGLDQEDILNQNYNIQFPCKNKPNPISSTEVIQSLVLTSSHPVDSEANSELEFEKNVQLSNSSVSISSGELMIDSGSSDGSIGNSSAVTDNEASVCAKQDSLDASLMKNNREFLNPGVQVPAWTGDANVLTQNQTLEHEYKAEYMGDVGCNPTHPDRFTEVGSGKMSRQKVSEGGDSFRTRHEVSHDKHYFNAKENQTHLSNEDVRKYSGHIYQEPDYENEAGNDCEFEAGNLGDVSGCYLEEGAIDALSNKYVPLPSQQRSQTKLPEEPTGDIRQPDYILLSKIVLVFTIVAGFAWKYYRK
ncbi:mitochondrial antiviral-signaling protein isoform X2 [Pristis pectinata]|uniref:mitochondrial antiviral-signaling protein isoform X2 n=1 Tax=Pristis pectinata TaxID=685728 RepID=UPI00223CB98E|nr:mitochondrial antiviral-signaling protein isoform X2 [Pristis pectinata]